MTDPQPTDRDRQNYAIRKIIADKFRREWVEALGYAMSLFSPGYEPTGRHSLVTHAESERARREGGRAVAAMSVITAKNAAGDARHFVVENGTAREVPGWKEAFGPMLTEPDPERTIEVRGESVHPHRYELHWSGFEPGYEPRTPEQLAEAREKREVKAEAKDAAELEEIARGSLFPDWVREQGKSGRKR